jgi:hypothetical protein
MGHFLKQYIHYNNSSSFVDNKVNKFVMSYTVALSSPNNFIVTPNARPSIGTLQKRMPSLIRMATQLNRRAAECP